MRTQRKTESSIVFRRWSRRGYAVFAGLHRHIVVGVLSVSICYAAMLKTGTLMYTAEAQICETLRSTDTDDPPEQAETICTTTTAEKTATSNACGQDACTPKHLSAKSAYTQNSMPTSHFFNTLIINNNQ